ncbi:hypothetical protein WOLCODRAFT_135649 [Wolfiporia cocos MD-104 SS10]|uniref:Uncharacterized protein n=1 Tax=Wolfiporia cocos (strain MD-104) TaxID=742152 RepID=A0A2H3J3H2_WOLCO|nr:hypothetical protein WOLCODRAFT_135649 [Wolfiporia cocos MD-104 SS10]
MDTDFTARLASSSDTTPPEDPPAESLTAHKKKKKKKPKKRKVAQPCSAAPSSGSCAPDDVRPPVLYISRNKHWRYISSYHGPWLQLPLELLESLLILNLDPATMSANDHRLPPPPLSGKLAAQRYGDFGFASQSEYSPPDSPHGTIATLPPLPPFPPPRPGKAMPPPIDPGVFRSVTSIRRLIDEASELSVRATSGLSAAALGSLRSGKGGNNPWATAQSLGLNPLGESGVGRSVTMSATRVHRLRQLAVQKLAAAYRADEIAASVMVMQGGSVFDDIAERVLKVDPHDADARYVHFFHEKIPSRHLAESTTTQLLDELIAAHPQRLEFFRTRAIVHCFRDEYTLAVKDFTHVIREARAIRKAKMAQHISLPREKRRQRGNKGGKTNGQAPPSGTSADAALGSSPTILGPDGQPLLLHPSILPDAPEPIEPQCLFLRAAAYLQHASFLIEDAVLKLEGVQKAPTVDGAEFRLCYIEHGRYGGVEIGHPDGPLGRRDGAKLAAYRVALAEPSFYAQVATLVRKSLRDHKQFLAHFDSLDGCAEGAGAGADLVARVAHAFALTEAGRPATREADGAAAALSDAPATFTTYHPLLVESHFSALLCHLLLGDFPALLPAFVRTAAVVDGLEGYPVFLPPRSMAQAEFIEVLERLAGGWRVGVQPHSFSRLGARYAKGAIDAAPSTKAKEVERASRPSSPDSDRLAASITTLALGVNGSSSSTAVHVSPPQSGRDTPSSPPERVDLAESLDCARILLAPVVARQQERRGRATSDKMGADGRELPFNLGFPLHGPRVEIILAWLGAVHLPELDGVA